QRLIIEARREDYGGQRFTSARLKSKHAWTYGRLQIKAKLPSGRGLWPAIWMVSIISSKDLYFSAGSASSSTILWQCLLAG
ncbi:unnamed protein product, partial [Rotaria magnacalcarata]